MILLIVLSIDQKMRQIHSVLIFDFMSMFDMHKTNADIEVSKQP